MPRPAPTGLPIGFAHRGARSERRENTLPAFRRALDLGATGLESDAWLTADGVVVLDHDGVVRRGVRRHRIAALRREQLPAHIPSLAELYRECGSAYELSLDVKDPAAVARVLDIAAGAGAKERLWLCDASSGCLTEWRTLDDVVRLVHSTSLRELPEGLAAQARSLADAGVDAVNLRQREWTSGSVAEVHREGVLAFGWDAQSEAVIRRLVDAGIDGLYSDDANRMMAVLDDQAGQDQAG